ncbi:MAG TPA: ABC transporter permease [Candidatus Limnocylindrales bacterium]|nr:ABC transporter permease [Candidatus Limnocylindrales bacterium]
MKRVFRILSKDFAVGPRKPFFIWALIMPFALTLLFQFAFGALFDPKPRLGIVDLGNSVVTAEVRELEGLELTILSDVDELLSQVENHDLDAGLVLSAGFDHAVKAGEKPMLEFYISGESLASNRIIIAITAIDLIRGIEGTEAPVDVEMVYIGEPGLPISIRLIPIIVFYALVMAGIWVPSASLVEEKEKGTLTALLVTPARANEVLLAKWLLGFLFALILAVVTLLLNQAFGPRPFEAMVVIIVAAALNAMLGLMIGIFSKTATMLFTLLKSLGIFLFAPVIFYLFPEWPQWIAKFFPLYWIINPLWEVSIMGESLSSVWYETLVAVAITLGLVPIVLMTKKRMLV